MLVRSVAAFELGDNGRALANFPTAREGVSFFYGDMMKGGVADIVLKPHLPAWTAPGSFRDYVVRADLHPWGVSALRPSIRATLSRENPRRRDCFLFPTILWCWVLVLK